MPVRPREVSWEPLFDGLRRLRAAWPKRAWSWDSRLGCVSSSFDNELAPQARTAAAEALPSVLTPANLSRASSALREVVERSGGLRTGQLLMAGPAVGRTAPYGLWWPWVNGLTISLRIGLAGIDWNDEPYPEFRDLFNVTL